MKNEGRQGYYALFEEYPALEKKLRVAPIGFYPTPVQEAPQLAEALGVGRIFIKRDDLSHPVYGGNKVRKLDFLLADASHGNYKKIITFGGIGSNHFLATTIHSAQFGIKAVGVLVPQPVTAAVKKNMLCDVHFGAEMHLAGNYTETPGVALKQMTRHTIRDGKPPYVVPAGGSAVIGVIGYINAAFELKKQIEAGVLPEPDMIFVAVGTCGTASGILAGCRAAGLKSRVIGVKVTDWISGNTILFASLANQAVLQLFTYDRRFPLNFQTPFNVELLTEYFGGEYGKLTPEGAEAIEMTKSLSGVKLEGVYTGKAFAGLIGTARKQDLSGKTVLYWNTYNSADLSSVAAQHDYHELPEEFHGFFEMPEHAMAEGSMT
jgi:1-aminocyclopropane-1-carboxylate deaminase/D-cysteine desulfhydrase-like pyridoxal-dependent ACC family enzyme